MRSRTFFEEAPRPVFHYKIPEELSAGDVIVTELSRSGTTLPSPGSRLSGEDIDILKTENIDGVVTRSHEDHSILRSPDEFSLPEPFEGLEKFFKEDDFSEVAEDLSLALDVALYRGNQALHSELVEQFRELQSILDLRKKSFNLIEEDDDQRRKYARNLYEMQSEVGPPSFRAEFSRMNRKFVRFQQLKRSLYDQLAETISEYFDTITEMVNGIEFGSGPFASQETERYHRFLLEDASDHRIDLSPLNDFSPERTNECLVIPVHNEDDELLRAIISQIKQLIDNILFRGVLLEKRFEDLLETLNRLTERDDELFTKLTFPPKDSDYLLSHIINVWLLSVFTARDLGLSKSEVHSLGKAALFFDLGMLRVPPSVWREADKPSDEGIDRIKRHPLLSVEWLEQSYYNFRSETLSSIKRHHERLDGSGYPLKIDRKELSTLENILLVVDVYDAMSTTRPHRAAISPDKIITYLKNRLNKFQEAVVHSLEENLGSYPPGTVVQLNTNEIGVAVPGGSNPSAPRVKVMIDNAGNVYDDPEVIDLDQNGSKRIIDTIGNRNTPTAILDLMGQ